MRQSLDVHGTGTIDYQEFLAATVHTCKLDSEENLHAAFSEMDTIGCGYITADDVAAFMQKMGMKVDLDEVKENIIAPVDTDKDGRVGYEDFVAVMAPTRRNSYQHNRRTSYP